MSTCLHVEVCGAASVSAVVSTLIPPFAQMASAISSVIASPHSAPAASDCTSADSGCASAAAMSTSRPPASAMCFAISSVTVKLRSAPAVPASTCDEGGRRGEHLHAVKASMFDEGANPRPTEPNGAHQTPSNAIKRHRTPSEAIKCHPWQSVAISGNQSGNRVTISGNQWRSEAIRGTDGARVVTSTFWFFGCAPAAAIKCNQVQSSVLASTFWFCGCAPAAAISASIPPESAMDSAISSTSDRFRSAAVTCVRRQGGHQTRHLRQMPGRSSAAMQCHQQAQIPQGRAVTCV